MRAASGWVHRAAAILGNKRGLAAAGVRRRDRGLIAALARHRGSLGSLAGALDHFREVTRSYWPGPFRCYEVEGPPRTNDDLEQFFGSYRDRERRASGREVARPGTVVRGAVRPVAAAATRLHPVAVGALVPTDRAAWRSLRESLERRRAARVRGRRFRRDPVTDLRSLEEARIKRGLPA